MEFMDMIFKRYSCPFLVLDEMISSCMLHEFIIHLIETINQENKENIQWEYFLHKVFDKSYAEYIESLKPLPEVEEESESLDLEATIKDTMEIFNIELNN